MGGVEVELSEVQRGIWELERLIELAGKLSPDQLRASRAQQLEQLRSRKAQLLSQLGGPVVVAEEGTPTMTGMWEPLAMYPPAVVVAPSTSAATIETVDAAATKSELNQIGWFFRFGPYPRFTRLSVELERHLAETSNREVLLVAAAAAHCANFIPLANALRRKVNLPFVEEMKLPDTPPLPGVGAKPYPDIGDGLTESQRKTFVTMLSGIDRPELLEDIARESKIENVLEVMLPLSEEGGARYPLVKFLTSSSSRRMRFTPLGEDIIRLSPNGAISTRLPLLLLLGHEGPPGSPPHVLGELVHQIQQRHLGRDISRLAPDFTHGGALEETFGVTYSGSSRICQFTDVHVGASPSTYRARISIRDFVAGASRAVFEEFLSTAHELFGVEPFVVARSATGEWTIDVPHVAFVSRIVFELERRELTQRRRHIALRVIDGESIRLVSARTIIESFIVDEKNRMWRELQRNKQGAESQLALAKGFVVGAHLHSLVDELVISAASNQEAVWALTQFRSPELSQNPSFAHFKLEKYLAACSEVIEQYPELRSIVERGFSTAQATRLVREKRLATKLSAALREWSSLKEQDDDEIAEVQQIKERFIQELDELARRHADERRTRVINRHNRWSWSPT